MSYNDWPSRVIPGGAHTYSKGDDQFPAIAPRFLERGQGARVWDDRDNEYLDWMMGLRTMTLGYGQEAVIAAAVDQIYKGSNFGRPSRIEMETAGDLIDLIPSAEMVKFAKNGSTVTTAAVKLARAYTGRDLVALCSDHPFFSYDDWAIGVTACNAGIPEAVRTLSASARCFVVTSKRKDFAARIVASLEFAGAISGVYGTEPDGSMDDKARLIAAVLRIERLGSVARRAQSKQSKSGKLQLARISGEVHSYGPPNLEWAKAASLRIRNPRRHSWRFFDIRSPGR